MLELCLVCRAIYPLCDEMLFWHLHAHRQLPIWRAVAHGRLDMAKKSLKKGADINAEYQKLTPLCLAVKLRQR